MPVAPLTGVIATGVVGGATRVVNDHTGPAADTEAVTLLQLRTSFSHAGVVCVAPAMNVVAAPVDGRVMNSIEPFGRTSRSTCADPASDVSRSITPALAYVFVFSRPVTLATICMSPL